MRQSPVGDKFGSVRRGKVWPVSPGCRYRFIPAALQTAYSLIQATQGLQYTTYNTSLRQQHKSQRPRRVQCTGNSYGCWVTVRRYALVLESNKTVELDGGFVDILGSWVWPGRPLAIFLVICRNFIHNLNFTILMANVISLPIKLSSGAKYEHGTRRKFDKLFLLILW